MARFHPRIAAATTPGTRAQLARSSREVSRRSIVCAVRWLGNVAGLGMIVSGCRSTAFSIPSSIEVLCTHPVPLWMSAGSEPG